MRCVKCNYMYKRSEYLIIKNRLEEPRKFIQVVMGPRQVGKSTVVKQVLQDLDAPWQFYSADNVPASHLLSTMRELHTLQTLFHTFQGDSPCAVKCFV